MDDVNSNSPITPLLRYAFIIIAVVLISGASLFFIPNLMMPRWPWVLKPFNARFLGAIYSAELVVILFALKTSRWEPTRLALPQAFIFTTLVTLTSLLTFGHHFDLGKLMTWAWFIAYIGSAIVVAYYVWLYRDRKSVNPIQLSSTWRNYLLIQGIVLGLYGVGLFLAPGPFSAFWPWLPDIFHGQMYSAIFISGAVGSLILFRAAAPVELLSLGVSQAIFGLFVVVGMIIVDASVRLVDWSSFGTWSWLIAFALMFFTGIGIAWQSRSK